MRKPCSSLVVPSLPSSDVVGFISRSLDLSRSRSPRSRISFVAGTNLLLAHVSHVSHVPITIQPTYFPCSLSPVTSQVNPQFSRPSPPHPPNTPNTPGPGQHAVGLSRLRSALLFKVHAPAQAHTPCTYALHIRLALYPGLTRYRLLLIGKPDRSWISLSHGVPHPPGAISPLRDRCAPNFLRG